MEDHDRQFEDYSRSSTEKVPGVLDFIPPWVFTVVIAVVTSFLLYRIVRASAPPEEDANPFNAKKKKPKYVTMDKMPVYLYRLARASEPSRNQYGEPIAEVTVGQEAAEQAGRVTAKAYWGDPQGLDAKCIHLSMADQVKDTAKLYFKDADDLILLKFSVAALTKNDALELKFEAAQPAPGVEGRGGVFPHVYGAERGVRPRLSYYSLKAAIKLPLAADGQHTFPDDALSEA